MLFYHFGDLSSYKTYIWVQKRFLFYDSNQKVLSVKVEIDLKSILEKQFMQKLNVLEICTIQ